MRWAKSRNSSESVAGGTAGRIELGS